MEQQDLRHDYEYQKKNLYELITQNNAKYMLFPKEQGQQTGIFFKIFQSEKQMNFPEFNKGIIMFDQITKKNCPTQTQFLILFEIYFGNTGILEIVLHNIGLIFEKFSEFEQLFPRDWFIEALFNYLEKQSNADLAIQILEDETLFQKKLDEKINQQALIQNKRIEKQIEEINEKQEKNGEEYEEIEYKFQIVPKTPEEDQYNRLRKHFFTFQSEEQKEILKKYDNDMILNVLKYTLSLVQKNFYSPLYQCAVIIRKMNLEHLQDQIKDYYLEKFLISAENIKKGFAIKMIEQLQFGDNFNKIYIQELIKFDRLDAANEFCQKLNYQFDQFPQLLDYNQKKQEQRLYQQIKEKILEKIVNNQNYLEVLEQYPELNTLSLKQQEEFLNIIQQRSHGEEVQIGDLSKKQRIKICLKIIEYFNKNPDDFPLFKKHGRNMPSKKREINKLEKIIKENSWEKIEEIFKGNISFLIKAVDLLIQKQKTESAINLIIRNNLNLEGFLNTINSKQEQNKIEQLYQEKKEKIDIQNNLYQNDQFAPTEQNLNKKNSNNNQYLNLVKDFQIESVYWVDTEDINNQINQQNQQNNQTFQKNYYSQKCKHLKILSLKQAIQNLNKNEIFAIDAEWEHAAINIIEEGGNITEDVETLQISTINEVYVFDAQKLKKNTYMIQFLYQLFESNKNTIIGFSVQNDIQHLKKHFRIASREFQNNNSNNNKNSITNKAGCQIIDLEDLGKLKLEQNFKSLADLVKLIYKDRIFSKCEQFSNWVYRPLRLAQIHYAALDAHICINLYQNLKKM